MSLLKVSLAPSMSSIDRAEWDSLAAPSGNPFLSWGFLALLEESGSIAPETGWTPLHLLLRRGGRLVAAAPFYARTSSEGEFIFDFGIARYAHSMREAWYPKLVGTVPATPSPVWRVLVAGGEEGPALEEALIAAALRLAREGGFGGLHLQWADRELGERLRGGKAGGEGFLAWEHQSFLWRNEGYRDFDDYLSRFSKNMRRNVIRERSGLDAAGVERRMVDAAEAAATPGLLSLMADLYESTNEKFGPWAAKWLSRDFFLRLPEFLPSGWALGAAYRGGGEPFALSFLLRGAEGLWGRYWGTKAFEDGLHFELCYYLPISWAIGEGLREFDPGMGSEHKARRGFRSLLVPSFHAIFGPKTRAAARRAFAEARGEELAAVEALNAELPFRKAAGA